MQQSANNLYDKLTGHEARILGDNNEKNGPDRIVDGILIQSKYCATGSRCINECFEEGGKGEFRYLCKDGSPMQIEVPSDKYEAALEAMAEKIRRGQVNGVKDPEDAKKIVKKGHFTYEQAKNIAKFGKVESLVYDSVNGVIIATSAMGVTALITMVTMMWKGEEFNVALKGATFSGLKVGGTAFVTSVLASQLSKAGMNSALVSSSEAVTSFIGPKASAVIANAFRSGSNIYGAAAMKSAAKVLRGNVISSGVTVVVLSVVDIINIFRKRISGKQLCKNIVNTAATVAGGSGGWVAGAALGSMVLPGAGTVIGGIIGSAGVGTIAGKGAGAVMDKFMEDDADKMVEIMEDVFAELSVDYLLNQEEVEAIVEKLSNALTGKHLKNMYASEDRRLYAKELVLPLIEEVAAGREYICAVDEEKMMEGLKEALEELFDTMEEDALLLKGEEKEVICLKCGQLLGMTMNFCPNCGEPKPQVAYCAFCGSELVEKANFCTQCGKPVKKINEEKEVVSEDALKKEEKREEPIAVVKSDEDETKAREYYERGVQKYNQRELEKAYECFETSLKYKEISNTYYYLAQIIIEDFWNTKFDHEKLNLYLEKGFLRGSLLSIFQIVELKFLSLSSNVLFNVKEELVAKVYQQRKEWEGTWKLFIEDLAEILYENEYQLIETEEYVLLAQSFIFITQIVTTLDDILGEELKSFDEIIDEMGQRESYFLELIQYSMETLGFEDDDSIIVVERVAKVMEQIGVCHGKWLLAYLKLNSGDMQEVQRGNRVLKDFVKKGDWGSALVLAEAHEYGELEDDEKVIREYYMIVANHGVRGAMEKILNDLDYEDKKAQAFTLTKKWVAKGYSYADDIYKDIFY